MNRELSRVALGSAHVEVRMAAVYGIAIQRFRSGETIEAKQAMWEARDRATAQLELLKELTGSEVLPYYDVEPIEDEFALHLIGKLAREDSDGRVRLAALTVLQKSTERAEVVQIAQDVLRNGAESRSLREQAVRLLVESSMGIAALAEHVHYTGEAKEIRLFIVRSLSLKGRAESWAAVGNLARLAADAEVRMEAATQLIKADRLAGRELEEIYEAPQNSEYRYKILSALAEKGRSITRQDREFLSSCLSSEKQGERVWSVIALSHASEDPRTSELLYQHLAREQSTEVRGQIVDYFASKKHLSREALRWIIINDPHPANRRAAEEALGKLGD